MLDSVPAESNSDNENTAPAAAGALVRVQRIALKTAAPPSSTQSTVPSAAETLFESPGFAALLAEFKASPNVATLSTTEDAIQSSSGAASSVQLAHPLAGDRTLRIETSVKDESSNSGGVPAQYRTAVFLAFQVS